MVKGQLVIDSANYRQGLIAALEAAQKAAKGVEVKTTDAGELQLAAITAMLDAIERLIRPPIGWANFND